MEAGLSLQPQNPLAVIVEINIVNEIHSVLKADYFYDYIEPYSNQCRGRGRFCPPFTTGTPNFIQLPASLHTK